MLYRAACQQTTQYPVVFAGDREHVRIHRGRIVSEPSQVVIIHQETTECGSIGTYDKTGAMKSLR